MKLFATLFSAITLFILVTDYYQNNVESNVKSAQTVPFSFKFPARAEGSPSEVEQRWTKLKKQREDKKKKPTVEPVKTTGQQLLKIGDQSYVLYGIFNDPDASFVLLKDEAGEMLKLTKGDTLAKNATLVTLQSNKIAFDKNNQIIEFKLFERKNNASN